jgi:hypothetical protein
MSLIHIIVASEGTRFSTSEELTSALSIIAYNYDHLIEIWSDSNTAC